MSDTHLSQSALKPSQEVVIGQVHRLVIDVVDAQLQLLDLLKVVVHTQARAEGGVLAVIHTLCTVQLHIQTHTDRHASYLHPLNFFSHSRLVLISSGLPKRTRTPTLLHSYLCPLVITNALQKHTKRIRLRTDILVQKVAARDGEFDLRHAISRHLKKTDQFDGLIGLTCKSHKITVNNTYFPFSF